MTDCDLTHARAATITVDAWIDKYVMSSKRATARKTQWYLQMLADQAAIQAPPPPPVAGVFVSPTGSDTGGDGSQLKPYATPAKTQAGQTVLYRGGRFDVLTPWKPLDGQTWQAFQGEPVVLDGGSHDAASGTRILILIDGVSKVTLDLDHFDIQNFRWCGVGIHGGSPYHEVFPTTVGRAAGNTIRNGRFHDGSYDLSGYARYCAPIFGRGNVPQTTVEHNAVWNADTGSINIAAGDGGYVAGMLNDLLIGSNALHDVCRKVDDAGAVYWQDIPANSTNIRIPNNFIRDIGKARSIYADDASSNALVTGNIMAGMFDIAAMIHGGRNNKWRGNLVDICAFSTNGPRVMRFQGSSIPTDHAGNEWTNNIIVSRAARWPVYWLDFPMTIRDNLYWAYAGAHIDSSGDTYPVLQEPKLSGRTYDLAADSPAYQAPVSFPPLVRGWGPPGYVIPAGTAPSYS